MTDYLTVAEVYLMQHGLIEISGGLHGVRDKGTVAAAEVFLRRNGFYIEVEGLDGHAFVVGSIERHEFRFAQIRGWIRRHIKALV
jgi:prophage maintenance system killer protein